MAIPRSREDFKELMMRNLGAPVIEINVTEDQVDDQIDYSLKMFADYHFDGSEKIYYKYQLNDNNRPDAVFNVMVKNAGSGYSNNDVVVFSSNNPVKTDAVASIVTDGAGRIQSVNVTEPGVGYSLAPGVTIQTTTGSGAVLKTELGGFIPVPENVMGVVNIFDITAGVGGGGNLFDARFQLAVSDILTAGMGSLVPYYMTMTHISLLDQLLVGKQPLRYNRHKNKLYIDMDWSGALAGTWVIAEAYEVLDPDEYTDVWSDRWLNQYCTERIKKIWGGNMKKFNGVAMIGGTTFNGQQIWEEADAAIKDLEHELVNSYSIPSMDMIG